MGRSVIVPDLHRGPVLRGLGLLLVGVLLFGPWVSWALGILGAGPHAVFMPVAYKAPGVAPTPTPKAMFYDPFDDPNSGWPRSDEGDWSVDYVNGEYQILIRAPSMYVGVTPGVRCTDCAVEVDGRFASPSYGAWGILFGITDMWDAYLFRVDGEQRFSLYSRSGATWRALVDWTPSTQILPGQATNRLRVERRGTTISLYANGQHLQTIAHDSFAGNLRVGATASAYESANVDVRLDDYKVYAMSGAPESERPGVAVSMIDRAREAER